MYNESLLLYRPCRIYFPLSTNATRHYVKPSRKVFKNSNNKSALSPFLEVSLFIGFSLSLSPSLHCFLCHALSPSWCLFGCFCSLAQSLSGLFSCWTVHRDVTAGGQFEPASAFYFLLISIILFISFTVRLLFFLCFESISGDAGPASNNNLLEFRQAANILFCSHFIFLCLMLQRCL